MDVCIHVEYTVAEIHMCVLRGVGGIAPPLSAPKITFLNVKLRSESMSEIHMSASLASGWIHHLYCSE